MNNKDAALIEKIENLKIKRNAIVVAHNFQLGEIQDIADFVGDSLEISQKAAESKAETIVVCGVDYVVETVATFCPDKTVLTPALNAICPMAEMITAERLREKKKQYPGAKVVCYLKAPAEVIAEADLLCTSANAVAVVEELPADEQVMFVPDQYLGDLVCTKTDRDMILWPGYCPSHVKISPEEIDGLKEAHPRAKLVVHPDCTPQVKARADAVLSAAEMVRFARETDAEEIIVGAETGLLHRLRKENPTKTFIPASERSVCGKMKLITIEKVLWSLENMTNEVKVPDSIRVKFRAMIDTMLEGNAVR